jgi:FkbM family methyltransferase
MIMLVGIILHIKLSVLPIPTTTKQTSSTTMRGSRHQKYNSRTSRPTPPSLDTTNKQDLEEILTRHKNSLVYLGTKASNTGWNVDTICLTNKPELIVYGVGAGEDISWDVGLVEKFNANVFIYDPTEKSLKYTRPIVEQYSKSHPHKLSHTPEGMSDEKGILTFAMPENPDHVSLRTIDLATKNMLSRTVQVPVNSLQNWMSQNNHNYLDILKIDIEGSEYPVLEALIAAKYLPFTQLLVEYHDRFLPDKSRHSKLLFALKQAGFTELWSSHEGQEVGYIKVADLAYCEDGKSVRYAS